MTSLCPNCGHIENYWRPSTWDVEKMVAHVEDVKDEINNPDPRFVYRLSRDGKIVSRLPKIVFEARGRKWQPMFEGHRHIRIPKLKAEEK